MKLSPILSQAVFVVMPPRTLLLDVAGPVEVLRKANLEQDKLVFDVRFVGPLPALTSSIGLTLAGIQALPPNLPADAIVVVVGSAHSVMGHQDDAAINAAAEAGDAAIVAWLQHVILPKHRVIGICSGALLMGRAGLLDDHACTTHHACCAELSTLAPRARVLENRLFVEDRHRLTSAGITSGTDLMLHLVAKLTDPQTAAAIARYLVVYLRRTGDDPQASPWLSGRNHLHSAVHRAQDAIVANPTQDWSLAALAAKAGAGPRHLSRLFNQHTGMTIADYANGLRVALAHELLAGTRLDMEHVAERVGLGSARQLRRVWSKVYGSTPREARKRA